MDAANGSRRAARRSCPDGYRVPKPAVRAPRRAAPVRLGRSVRVRILSRASDLARLQAMLVWRALQAQFPELDVHAAHARVGRRSRHDDAARRVRRQGRVHRGSVGRAPRRATRTLVVHSWKDLPLEASPTARASRRRSSAPTRATCCWSAETCCRRGPRTLDILSSSPRRVLAASTRAAASSCRGASRRSSSCRCAATSRRGCRSSSRAAATRWSSRRPRSIVCWASAAPFEDVARAVRAAIDQCAGWCCRCATCPARRRRARWRSRWRRRPRCSRERSHAISHRPTWERSMQEREMLAALRRRLPRSARRDRAAARVRPRRRACAADVERRRAKRWSLATSTGDACRARTRAPIWPRARRTRRAPAGALEVAGASR